MALPPELKTLVKCHEELIVVIRNNLQAISCFLLLEEIISHETYRVVTDSESYHTDHKRAAWKIKYKKMQNIIHYFMNT